MTSSKNYFKNKLGHKISMYNEQYKPPQKDSVSFSSMSLDQNSASFQNDSDRTYKQINTLNTRGLHHG